MSDTPRTDAYTEQFPGCLREPKLLDFCRQLEKQLAEARAEIESLTRSLTIVANWKNVKMTYTADEVKEFARGILDVAALEAAERVNK